jgi:hypothetical protein
MPMKHKTDILSSRRKIKLCSSKGKRICLFIQRVECSVYSSYGFKQHHYMIEDIKGFMSFLFTTPKGKPFAFVAVRNQPHRGYRNGVMVSRLVIMPSFQGKGYSVALTALIGGLLAAKGQLMYINTHKERYGTALGQSRNFESTTFDDKDRGNTDDGKFKNRQGGIAYRKKYVGKAIYGYKDLFCDIKTMRTRAKDIEDDRTDSMKVVCPSYTVYGCSSRCTPFNVRICVRFYVIFMDDRWNRDEIPKLWLTALRISPYHNGGRPMGLTVIPSGH